ncbi:hypothetical protein KAR91_58695 [Candidatus Pacearchaeota archaeon]|nr:hypothetical protein [Candidatus Pacearchaeota archaeon]
MASTKVVTVLDNDVTLTAGAGDHTSDTWTVNDGYGGELYIKITNGGTGPTIAAQVLVQTSPDNSNWYNLTGPIESLLGNSIVSMWTIPIAAAAQHIKVISGSNTGQDVVIRVEGSEITALS